MTTEDLVDQALLLQEKIDADCEQLAALKQKILKKGKGKHSGNLAIAEVIHPQGAIKAGKDSIIKARQMLSTAEFKALFEQVLCNFPVKNFRDVAKAMLKRRAASIIKLFEQPATPYVKLARAASE